jgi:hypothetical protein
VPRNGSYVPVPLEAVPAAILDRCKTSVRVPVPKLKIHRRPSRTQRGRSFRWCLCHKHRKCWGRCLRRYGARVMFQNIELLKEWARGAHVLSVAHVDVPFTNIRAIPLIVETRFIRKARTLHHATGGALGSFHVASTRNSVQIFCDFERYRSLHPASYGQRRIAHNRAG